MSAVFRHRASMAPPRSLAARTGSPPEDGAFDAALEEAVAASRPSSLGGAGGIREAKRRREEASRPPSRRRRRRPTEKIDPREQPKLDAIGAPSPCRRKARAEGAREAAQAEKDAADPCTCGHARSRRLPRPRSRRAARGATSACRSSRRAQPCWGGPCSRSRRRSSTHRGGVCRPDGVHPHDPAPRTTPGSAWCSPPASWQPPSTFRMRAARTATSAATATAG